MQKGGTSMKHRSWLYVSAVAFLIAGFLIASVHAQQQTITAEEAENYIGQVKTVCGKVASAKYAERSNGQPTFLNLNDPYPFQPLTIVIWGSDRDKFENPPETFYSDKNLCVTGTISSHKGTPQIIVNEPSQITIAK
jgi:DNA/RNA endonuclease YhcR with UshA esterase domain